MSHISGLGILPLLTSASLKNLEGQYAHQGDPNVGYAPPGNAQNYLAVPVPPHIEYNMPPAHVCTHTHSFCLRSVCIVPDCIRTQGIPNGDQVPPTSTPDVARNVPNSGPSRTSAREHLKRLANRYLHNPDSRVDTLRMELSPSGSRFMVMIILEVDDII